jgi:hypothetical protein
MEVITKKVTRFKIKKQIFKKIRKQNKITNSNHNHNNQIYKK